MGNGNCKFTTKTALDTIIDEHKPLGKEDLRWLLDIYRDPSSSEEDKKTAHELIVIPNLRMVRWIANFRVYRHNPMEDILSAGFIGLVKAIDRYDPDKGAFSTYAFRWIFSSIRRYKDYGNLIRIPEHMRITIRKYKKAYERLRQELQEDPATEQVLGESGIDRICEDPNERICHFWYESTANENHEDLADPDNIAYFKYDRASLDAITADPNGNPAGEQLENKELIEEILPELLDVLSEREQYIVRKRFLEGKTLREVADTLSVSKSRIGQIEEMAIIKMRNYAEKHHPEYFPGNV